MPQGEVPQAIRDCFQAYDENGDGKISKSELSDVLMDLDPEVWTPDAVSEFWEKSCLEADLDGDGALNLREFLLWVYSGGDEEQKAAAFEENDSDDDEDAPFHVLKMTGDKGVKVLEFDNKKNARKRFKRFRKRDRTALMVKDNTIRPGKVCGGVNRAIFLIGLAYGKGISDLGPCAMAGSDYCVFPDGDESDEGEEEEEEEEEVDEDAYHIVWANRQGTGIGHEEVKRKRKAIRMFKKKAGRGRTIILAKCGEIVRFRGDGDDDGGEFDDQVQKELLFIVGAALGKEIISGIGPFESGGDHSIFDGYEDDDDDEVDSDDGGDSDDDEDAPFSVLKMTRKDKIKVFDFDNKKKARKRFRQFKNKEVTALMVKDGAIRPGKVCGEKYRAICLMGMAYGRGLSDYGPCMMPDSEYCVFDNAGDDSGDEGEGEEEEDDEVDEDAFHMVWANLRGSGIVHKEFKRRRQAMKKFKRRAGAGRTIILVKGGEILRFRGDGDDDGGEFDDEVHKELAFIIGAAYGKGIISDWGPFEDGGSYPLLGEGFEDDDDNDSD